MIFRNEGEGIKMGDQKKILVLSASGDPVVTFFKRFLAQEGLLTSRYLFLDSSRFARGLDVSQTAWIWGGEEKIMHRDVGAVWNRLVTGVKGWGKQKSIEVYAIYLMDEVYPNVLNRPKDGMSNFSKPYQIDCLDLNRIRRVEGGVIAGGCMRLDFGTKNMIYKSISGVRSIVRKVTKRDRHRWIKEPVLFQRLLKGDPIRVHVIKNHVEACRCLADRIDYRYANYIKMEQVRLPAWLKRECIEITEQLGLVFAGIDLIKSQNKYYILEVNPAPGYAYFDLSMGISRAINAYLCKAIR